MGVLSSVDWLRTLPLINALLASGIVILSFALVIYLLLYNRRSNVARAFCALLACVLVVYFADLAMNGGSLESNQHWLRFQWLGIAFTPAAYLHFSVALLETTNDRSRTRSLAVRGAYFFGGLILSAAVFTDLLVRDGVEDAGAFHLQAGPLFWLFFTYFALVVGWGALNLLRAWLRCLTSTSRRRMTYLSLSFLAPAVGVFPYLLIAGWPRRLSGVILWLLVIASNLAVGAMLGAMSYTVAFFGTLTPDRVVKHRFVRFILRGPLQATVVVMVILVAQQTDGFLGLPPLRLTLFGVVIAILLTQQAVELAKPLIDRLLYRRDRQEITWLQDLSNHLLTSSDLHQFLENALTALCDLLRTPGAFLASLEDGQAQIMAKCGALEPEQTPLPEETLEALADGHPAAHIQQHGPFFIWNGYWLLPLRSQPTGQVVGILGMTARDPLPQLSAEEEEGLQTLTAQIETALEDRRLQQSLFATLDRLRPQIEDIQQRGSLLRYEGPPALRNLDRPAEDAEFSRWVHDALAHYWGGPKLTSSPLLNLQVVERASREHGSSVNALRAVLVRAIENLRPEGDRSMTTAEWLLYNILELKFLRGYRVRDVAMRLAMSESDLYRKQRIAIEEVARVLAEMERQEQENASSA